MILPPNIFPPEWQPLVYFTILPLTIIAGIILIVIFWLWFVPPEAKVYIKNKLSRKLMIDYESESGIRKIETCKAYPEGIVVGDTTKNVYFLPRPISNAAIKKLLQKDKLNETQMQQVIEDIRDMENRSVRPGIVGGIGCKIYRAYTSKAIGTSISTLAGLEYSGDSKKVTVVIQTPESPKLLKKINEQLKTSNVVRVLLPVDPSIIQKFFNAQYTESAIRARDRISEEIGRKDEKGYWKKILAFCGVLVGILVVAMVIVMVIK